MADTSLNIAFTFSSYLRPRFYELSRMLMRKNVNNDVSKDLPIAPTIFSSPTGEGTTILH